MHSQIATAPAERLPSPAESTAGHSRADSGHLPLGGNLLPNRTTLDTPAGPSNTLSRTDSNAPLLLTPPALQSTPSPTAQVQPQDMLARSRTSASRI